MPSSDADELPSVPPNPKLQRWVDLLAALLSHNRPVSFEELASSVPEYLSALEAARVVPDDRQRRTILQSLKRTFERDKDELRTFGVPIESLPDTDGNDAGTYRLRRRDFYLPYLCLATGNRRPPATPARVDRWGYHALASLTFEADELQAVVDAAAAVRALGDPLLESEATSALRKLAVDLPVGTTAPSAGEPHVVLPRSRPDATVFETLGDALVRRKLVTFQYHAMSTDRTDTRNVAPYGLFFLSGHWYLAARDTERGELRNFRLDRITDAGVNAKRAQTPDYDIPATFHLRDHVRCRLAWELGDDEAMPAVVEFRGNSGPAAAARRLGRSLDDTANRRVFDVRRPNAFVRWLLSFAGELVPLAPDDIVRRYREMLVSTGRLYATPAPADAHPTASPSVDADNLDRTPWQPRGAAEQLRRVLHLVPHIADGEEHSLRDMAAEVGTTVETLRHDLYSLVARFDTPGGFVEGVQLFVEPDRVSAVSNHFARPMRLTVAELCALDLGLAVLRARRPPDEHDVLDRARERLCAVIAQLPGDPIPDHPYAAATSGGEDPEHLAILRTALQEHYQLRLTYRKSGSESADERVVAPCALVAASGALYLIAQCDPGDGIRVFRTDRIESAGLTDQRFEPPAEFSLDDVLRDGRVFHAEHQATMLVRYSPIIARWLAEREGRVPDATGALVLEHPLADPEWAVRHVLQYGPDAQLLAPAELRERLHHRVATMLEGVSD